MEKGFFTDTDVVAALWLHKEGAKTEDLEIWRKCVSLVGTEISWKP